ncbi:DUF1127 domain-containing protein [Thalassovita sp.]|uniref:DUF1127 domain-containing protein n=1 Tax=Thalassovita sp. TaxID=1979401 RepID=UPI0029DE6A98|nr:DUF1127 domain-containing protein [Thalassovita sp.]
MISAHSSVRLATESRRRPSVFALLAAAIGLRRQRARLAQLDDAALADIGLTRAEALREARRPLWDAPDNWML